MVAGGEMTMVLGTCVAGQCEDMNKSPRPSVGSSTADVDVHKLESDTTGSCKPCWADLSDDDSTTGEAENENGLEDEGVGSPKLKESWGDSDDTERPVGSRGSPKGEAPVLHASTGQWFFGSSPPGAEPTEPVELQAGPYSSPASDGLHRALAPCSVVIDCLPLELCSDACVDVILHQSGMEDDVVAFETRSGPKWGHAVVLLSSWPAAVRCYEHFSACSWTTGALRVHMALPESPPQGVRHFERDLCSPGGSAGAHQAAAPQRQHPDQHHAAPGDFMDCPSTQEWHGPFFDHDGSVVPFAASPHAHEMARACAYAHARALAGAPRQRHRAARA